MVSWLKFNIIEKIPFMVYLEIQCIMFKTEKSFIAHPWIQLSVVGLEEYSAHDWRAATSVQRAPVTWREWGLWWQQQLGDCSLSPPTFLISQLQAMVSSHLPSRNYQAFPRPLVVFPWLQDVCCITASNIILRTREKSNIWINYHITQTISQNINHNHVKVYDLKLDRAVYYG